MSLQEIAQQISIFLTSPTIFFGLTVLLVWGKECIKSIRREFKSPMDWLVMGVCFGFFGSVFDNMYWLLAWSSMYLDDPKDISDRTFSFYNYGIYFNILFRQSFGTLAAYCHLKSYTEMSNKSHYNSRLWIYSILIGFCYSVSLWLIKN